jgi:hypothetical protein
MFESSIYRIIKNLLQPFQLGDSLASPIPLPVQHQSTVDTICTSHPPGWMTLATMELIAAAAANNPPLAPSVIRTRHLTEWARRHVESRPKDKLQDFLDVVTPLGDYVGNLPLHVGVSLARSAQTASKEREAKNFMRYVGFHCHSCGPAAAKIQRSPWSGWLNITSIILLCLQCGLSDYICAENPLQDHLVNRPDLDHRLRHANRETQGLPVAAANALLERRHFRNLAQRSNSYSTGDARHDSSFSANIWAALFNPIFPKISVVMLCGTCRTPQLHFVVQRQFRSSFQWKRTNQCEQCQERGEKDLSLGDCLELFLICSYLLPLRDSIQEECDLYPWDSTLEISPAFYEHTILPFRKYFQSASAEIRHATILRMWNQLLLRASRMAEYRQHEYRYRI